MYNSLIFISMDEKNCGSIPEVKASVSLDFQ